jgi:hypothetical protein
MNNRGMIPFMTIFVLILVIMILAMKQNNVDMSTINKTIETLNWSNFNQNISQSIQHAAIGQPYYVVSILGIAEKAVDFFGYSVFVVAKLAMEVARDNPDIVNYKVLLSLIIFSLAAPIIYPLFIITVSLILIFKEWLQVRKEKKLLKKGLGR